MKSRTHLVSSGLRRVACDVDEAAVRVDEADSLGIRGREGEGRGEVSGGEGVELRVVDLAGFRKRMSQHSFVYEAEKGRTSVTAASTGEEGDLVAGRAAVIEADASVGLKQDR